MMQQQQYAAGITDPNMPVQFSATVDAVLNAYEQNPEDEAAQAELLRTVQRAVDLAKEMREFTNNCQREGLPLPDSFAAWHIALSKLTTQEVVDALNRIFDSNAERARKLQEAGHPDRGPLFETEKIEHIDLDHLRQSLKMTGDLGYGGQTAYYAAQEDPRAAYDTYERREEPAYRKTYERQSYDYDRTDRKATSTRNWLATLILCIGTGIFGGHCFYTGKIGKGILYFFTGGLWGLGVLYDLVKLASGTYEDGEGRVVRNQ